MFDEITITRISAFGSFNKYIWKQCRTKYHLGRHSCASTRWCGLHFSRCTNLGVNLVHLFDAAGLIVLIATPLCLRVNGRIWTVEHSDRGLILDLNAYRASLSAKLARYLAGRALVHAVTGLPSFELLDPGNDQTSALFRQSGFVPCFQKSHTSIQSAVSSSRPNGDRSADSYYRQHGQGEYCRGVLGPYQMAWA